MDRTQENTQTKKTYDKPTITKGPKLGSITAVPKGSAGPCWIAQAAFGRDDYRWLAFREWLLADAPMWFRNAYIRHGEGIGTWLAGHDLARALVRKSMMPAVRRKLNKG